MSNETNNTGFNDPLDEILDRIESQKADIVTPKIEEPSLPEQLEIRRDDPPVINYGDDDLDAENARIDQMIADEKIKKAEEAQRIHDENKGVPILPTPTTNPDAYAEEVNFQGNVLGIVTKMVKQVVSDYGLNSGGIPEEDPDNLDQFGNPTRIKQHVMGNLVAEYHMNGEIITQNFVSEILDNWIMADGTPARVFIENRDNPNNNATSPTTENKNNINNYADETDANDDKANSAININVYNADDTPINVNIDGTIIDDISEEKVVDVYVKRVTQQEMLSAKVIENCKTPGIIKPYDPGISDIPVTLPMSGYRAVLRPMSFMEVLTYIQPAARTAADLIYKQWSIIYKHIKWTSIGEFTDFNDFMEKTRFADQEFLMWAILVATATEKESLVISCKNPDCKHGHKLVYTPRNIIKIDPEAVPSYYNDADIASPGEEAMKVFTEKASTHTFYRMPTSGILIEFEAPSAADFINYKYPRLRKIFNEYYPDRDFDENLPNIMEMMNSVDQFGVDTLKFAIAIAVSTVSVPRQETVTINGVTTSETVDYKYTEWDDIDSILTESLTYDESVLLFTKLIPEVGPFKSPVSFELEPFKCEKCGNNNDNLHITNIAGQLLLPRSQTLMNTKVNLIEQPKNS